MCARHFDTALANVGPSVSAKVKSQARAFECDLTSMLQLLCVSKVLNEVLPLVSPFISTRSASPVCFSQIFGAFSSFFGGKQARFANMSKQHAAVTSSALLLSNSGDAAIKC